MSDQIDYGPSINAGSGSLSASLSTTETDVVIIKDQQPLRKSQITVYHSATLGGNTAIKLRYYVALKTAPGGSNGSASSGSAADWYEIPVKDLSTGNLTDLPSQLTGTFLQCVDDVAVPACYGFKVTAQGVGGGTGSITSTITGRDN